MRRTGRLDRRLHSAYVFVRRGFPAKRRCEVAWGSDVSALCRKDSRSGASRSGRLRTVCGAGRKAAPMAKFAVTNWRILESAKLRPGIMVGDARVCGCEQLENACEIVMGSILRPRRQDDLAPEGRLFEIEAGGAFRFARVILVKRGRSSVRAPRDVVSCVPYRIFLEDRFSCAMGRRGCWLPLRTLSHCRRSRTWSSPLPARERSGARCATWASSTVLPTTTNTVYTWRANSSSRTSGSRSATLAWPRSRC